MTYDCYYEMIMTCEVGIGLKESKLRLMPQE